MADSDENKGAYEVGYGKPPKHTRFQPGRSGNPRGKRKGTKGLKTLMQENLQKKTTIKMAGETRKVAVTEAMIMRLIDLALRGPPSVAMQAFKELADFFQQDDLPPPADLTVLTDEELEDFTKLLSKVHGVDFDSDLDCHQS
ncbi:hypothetical protein Ga0102493_111570 [Erythrobacter litoralis]|uniref:DUF5681 domain-containing protein n=1 Tax=Erythrobacter litoralis TaxID=39960 RepID=A0A074M5P3_9SPHN|nr:DUF5681 domain-containing protein [Erythrobacter litoralis]AOL22596.1 hypothetical protein Ga0102493_111570 [Erythrobacter litoralis]KEO90036.1 hypothetical protein EH32_03350 [Erythrobacter litoralis]